MNLLAVLKADKESEEWQEARKHHLRFKFLTSEEDRRKGYTLDGVTYFATLFECKLYSELWENMVAAVDAIARRVRRQDKAAAWAR